MLVLDDGHLDAVDGDVRLEPGIGLGVKGWEEAVLRLVTELRGLRHSRRGFRIGFPSVFARTSLQLILAGWAVQRGHYHAEATNASSTTRASAKAMTTRIMVRLSRALTGNTWVVSIAAHL